MHAIAHEGCTDSVRESALKVVSGTKITYCTGESNLPQWRASPTLYQLSYIPVPGVISTDYFQNNSFSPQAASLLARQMSGFCSSPMG